MHCPVIHVLVKATHIEELVDPAMDSYLHSEIVEKVLSALYGILKVAHDVRELAMDEMDSYPVYIPTFGSSNDLRTSTRARLTALDFITRVFGATRGEHDQSAGIFCASEELTRKVEAINNAKTFFAHTVTKAHRLASVSINQNSGRYISALLKDEIKNNRRHERFDLFTREQIIYNRIDLKACRRQIRVMPKKLDMFSWTWTSKHKRMVKLSKFDALKLAEKLPDSARDVAIEVLTTCSDTEFAKVTPLKEQLRANYAYTEGGIMVRKSTPISGVVIVPQKTLPRLLWREPPSTRERIQPRIQRETSVYDEPLISELSIYRYR